jgi:hypothetical protein
MALLLIILALFGFAAAGLGSGSPSISPASKTPPNLTKRHQRYPPLLLGPKCSKRMHAEPASSRCRPPANP